VFQNNYYQFLINDDVDQYQRLLGDGNQWGISLTYIEQPSSDGLAQAFILAEDFLDGSPSTLVLGDNLFFGHGLPELLNAANRRDGASIFAYQVSNPESYGVVSFDGGVVQSIEEKPDNPASDFAKLNPHPGESLKLLHYLKYIWIKARLT